MKFIPYYRQFYLPGKTLCFDGIERQNQKLLPFTKIDFAKQL